ncbi:hypothetical protein ACIOHC_43010 [Streptomyces sp. NPDC088252]|uniref:hypothetical protein n=1 Tax=unclassified Streptomyces TaxID=2593676 RepID=UPI0037F5D4FE
MDHKGVTSGPSAELVRHGSGKRFPSSTREVAGLCGKALVEEWPDAAPAGQLIAALRWQEYSLFTSRDRAAEAVSRWSSPLLRVTPHVNGDSCGFRAVHAAYSLAYSIPVLCRYPEELCVPPVLGTERLRRMCAHCFKGIDGEGRPVPGELPVAWKDVTDPQTLRAEAVPAEELLEATERARKVKVSPPEPYRWRELLNQFYE